jgi:hypothetical protein
MNNSKVNLFALNNNVSSDIRTCYPWEERDICAAYPTKAEFRKFYESTESQGCVFNGVEPANPGTRVTSENQAFRLHAAVADYDHAGVPDNEDLIDLARGSRMAYAPTHIGRSYSDGIRAVWLFEKPVLVVSNKHAKEFYTEFNRVVNARFLCKGLDKKSWDPTMYFERGRDWQTTNAKVIPQGMLLEILRAASNKIKWKTLGAIEIPIERVAEEAQRRGWRWDNHWRQNDHCARFWDPTSANDRGAILRESGVQCFTGEKPWMSWQEIFGTDFVNEYAAKRMANALDETHYVKSARQFFVLDSSHRGYVSFNEAQIKRHLHNGGLMRTGLDGGVSEIDEALNSLELNGLEGVVERFDKPLGVFSEEGESWLNIRKPTHTTPNAGSCTFALDFLDTAFQGDALPVFLTWLKRYYESIYYYKPRNGQTLFLGGDPECGKTLLNRVFIPELVGGWHDPTKYITGQSRFNSKLFKVPHWAIDDAVVVDSSRSRYMSLLKSLSVNGKLEVEGKGKDEVLMPWRGRICVTHNLDEESLRVLPDPDYAIREKTIVLRMSNGFKFGEDPDERLRKELPAFAQYLLDYDPPDELMVASRFGLESMHDESIFNISHVQGPPRELLEALAIIFGQEPDDHIVGSSTEILNLCQVATEGNLSLNVWGVGKAISKLMAMGAEIEVENSRVNGRVRRYKIFRQCLEEAH